jgi:phosphatidylglycerol:prolipoprotein diacylglycerol transferase
MYPLVEIGPLAFRTYTLAFEAGFLTALAIILCAGRADGLSRIRLFEVTAFSVCIGIVGARLLYVASNWSYFWSHPLEIVHMQQGMAFLGGPIIVVPFVLLYTRWVQLPLAKTLDLFALGLVPGLGITRLGCFANGCCHGQATTCPLGVRFDSPAVEAGLRGVPVHPTQLYEAAGTVLLAVVLLLVWRQRRFPGQVVLLFWMGYAVLRFLIEMIRGDRSDGFFLKDWLSANQCVCLVAFAAALPLYLALRYQAAMPASRPVGETSP